MEHDRDTMEAADYVVDFGPGPGTRGGEVVARGTLRDICDAERSLTGAYLAGRARIEIPVSRRPVIRPRASASVADRSDGRTKRTRPVR